MNTESEIGQPVSEAEGTSSVSGTVSTSTASTSTASTSGASTSTASTFGATEWGLSLSITGVLLGLGLAALPEGEAAVVEWVVQGLVVVLVAAGLILLGLRHRVTDWLGSRIGDRRPELMDRNPRTALFLVSFLILFIEVLLIRYTTSQVRIFSFYKNVPLVGCFLGLGLGCFLGRGRGRQALTFLAGLVPLSVFLAHGAAMLDPALGRWAASGSSEHILGDVVERQSTGVDLVSQLAMGLFCVVTFVVICGLFTLLGRLLGEAFETLPRLQGYTLNILGSLAGILGFTLLSYAATPPWLWFVVGLTPLVVLVPRPGRGVALALVVLHGAIVYPQLGETVWSPYQKLVGREIPAGPEGTGTPSPAYLVQISDVFYQVAIDLRPETLEAIGFHPFPHYDLVHRGHPDPERVLVVGAGTGNDVAAALRAGAGRVDAVDIDPAILEMGRRHHPEAPYSDPRVHWVVDDARRAFRELPEGSYDTVVFGLLDSHTQLGISSVRLDNYVFTVESLREASRLLRPGGRLVVSAAVFRPWFGARLEALVASACGHPPEVALTSNWVTYSCAPGAESVADATATPDLLLPTDDWPFLYLPERGVPTAYLVVLSFLALASVGVLRWGGLRVGAWTPSRLHLFCLGAAFLLLEVYAINRLALLFGTTWVVSAVTIAGVLLLIVLANLTLAVAGERVPYGLAYGALFLALLAGWWVPPGSVLGASAVWVWGYVAMLLSPVYFAGLVFARSFRAADVAGPALGANILGSVVGGWIEYGTMAVGIRTMALLALTFYLLSLLALLRASRSTVSTIAPDRE